MMTDTILEPFFRWREITLSEKRFKEELDQIDWI